MLFKWGVVGAIVGAAFAIFSGTGEVVLMALIGEAAFIAFRKWVLRTFWQ
ncbi:hypothetical protein [Clostridium intestinale]|nr:hypothetical protein [Clostridium intestinale]